MKIQNNDFKKIKKLMQEGFNEELKEFEKQFLYFEILTDLNIPVYSRKGILIKNGRSYEI